MAKNLKAKTRPIDKPYETYRNDATGFEWRVLKHYQSSEAEEANPLARVFCATRSPYTYGDWELGDGYLHSDVRRRGTLVQEDVLPAAA